MQYGNCLIGLLILMVRHRFRGRVVVIHTRGRLVPHLMYRVDGRMHHFKYVADVLPEPFYYLLFKGRFDCVA